MSDDTAGIRMQAMNAANRDDLHRRRSALMARVEDLW